MLTSRMHGHAQLTLKRILLEYLKKEKKEAQYGQWYQERIKGEKESWGVGRESDSQDVRTDCLKRHQVYAQMPQSKQCRIL